ncbi:hypothetical protein ABK040_007962 [Willaertia magna]
MKFQPQSNMKQVQSIAIQYWTIKDVSNYIKEIPFQIMDMSIVAWLFEYHCMTGIDLLEITCEDMKEILSTSNADIITSLTTTTYSLGNKVVDVEGYVNKVLKDNNLNIDCLAQSLHLCLTNNLKVVVN